MVTIELLKELIKEKKYNEFCDALDDISPRALRFLYKYAGEKLMHTFQEDLYENVSETNFKKWRHMLSSDYETDYIIKHNLDLYNLSKEEKEQACLT